VKAVQEGGVVMHIKIGPIPAGGAIALAAAMSFAFPRTYCAAQASRDWDNTPAQKIWGLMKVWGNVKYNFAFFDQVPDLDWDAAIQAATPRVLASENSEEYHRRLGELTALLHDGHTIVLSPSLVNGENDNPPVELQVVEDAILLVRIGDTEEIRAQGIRAGMELIAVEGIPAREYLEQNALSYYSGSTPQNGEAFGMFLLLNGPKNSTVRLTLKHRDGQARTVTLTRNSLERNGTSFKYRIFDYSRLVELKMLHDRIAYFRLSTFDDERIVEEFYAELDKLDLDGLKGMIIDLRFNMGGDDTNAYPLISRLIDRPVLGSTWSTREYLPAFASWGQPERSYQGDTVRIEPSTQARYTEPLIVLTGPNTMSTSEDFLVPLDYSGRALLVGEATAGTTGNPVNFLLPGGAILRVCSKRDTYPDGSQFVGRGIEPDITVHPSVAGIRANRDEVLEKAIEVLDRWDHYEAMAEYERSR